MQVKILAFKDQDVSSVSLPPESIKMVGDHAKKVWETGHGDPWVMVLDSTGEMQVAKGICHSFHVSKKNA